MAYAAQGMCVLAWIAAGRMASRRMRPAYPEGHYQGWMSDGHPQPENLLLPLRLR